MTQNYFKVLLEEISHNEESNKVKIKKPYRPNPGTLNKLTLINAELADFLSEFSPFNLELTNEPTEWRRFDSGKEFKKFFPITSTNIARLHEFNDDEMIETILIKWKEGITKSILANKQSFLFSNNTHIEGLDLVDIFLEPTIQLTKDIFFNKGLADKNDFLLQIARNSVRHYSNVNSCYQSIIKTYYLELIQKKSYTFDHIKEYKRSQFKALDLVLLEALEGTNYKNSLEVLQHIKELLVFVDFSKEEIMEKAKFTLGSIMKEVKIRAEELEKIELEYEEMKLETAIGKVKARELRHASFRHNVLKTKLKTVLELFANL